ncbi:MAG TPA: DUF5915 domain-containing protein, partial [Methanoregulaceae archaeon]|nr:DUF5915 domain-containing protein [Methanoregulaceae archaeon]
LGPAFGKNAPVVRELIRSADAAALKSHLDKGETVNLGGSEGVYPIQPGSVVFLEELPPNLFQAPMERGTVYVDVTLTADLEAEGYTREVIRRIQEMRRQRDLNVEDYITAGIVIDDERVRSLLKGSWEDVIREEVRAGSLTISRESSYSTDGSFELERDWDIEGIQAVIGISKFTDQPGKKQTALR